MTGTTDSPTLRDLNQRLAEARAAFEGARLELEAADAAVEAARERQGLGLAVRGLTIKAQVQRARKMEIVEVARSRIKGLERLVMARAELEAQAERDAEAARRRQLREDGVRLTATVALALQAIEDKLLYCASAVADWRREMNSNSPNTDARVERLWGDGTAALRNLRREYPVINTIEKESNPNA